MLSVEEEVKNHPNIYLSEIFGYITYRVLLGTP